MVREEVPGSTELCLMGHCNAMSCLRYFYLLPCGPFITPRGRIRLASIVVVWLGLEAVERDAEIFTYALNDVTTYHSLGGISRLRQHYKQEYTRDSTLLENEIDVRLRAHLK